jgi:hypothetical protein
MKPMLYLTAALLWGLPILHTPEAQMQESSPVTRRFTATKTYIYHSREYQPAVSIVLMNLQPKRSATPEEALISQLSALHKGDYDWWMGTWDPQSRDKLMRQQKDSAATREQWLQSMQTEIFGGSCRLSTWILRREYVILRYSCSTKARSGNSGANSHAVAFKSYGGEFVATLDIEKDPIFRYANGTDVKLEFRPRE